MKRYLLIIALGLSMVANAQIVSEREQALVYYMPKTEIALKVTYEVETRTAGRLSAYAHLLGAENVITKSDTVCRVLDIEAGTRTTADKQRVCKVLAEPGIDLQLLNINSKGLLAGYNNVQRDHVQSTKDVQRNQEPRTKNKEQGLKTKKTDMPAPLGEDALKAKTDADMAKAVLDQILRLREARLYLLTGESENPPKDGKQFDLMLKAIHKEEQQLTELFVGKRELRREEKYLYYSPEQSTEVILARLNENGLVDAEETGLPIRLTISTTRQRLMSASEPKKKDKKAPQPSSIYYNLPGEAHYTVTVGEKEWVDRTIWVAQLGVSVPLTRDLFQAGTKIVMNTKTGNVESICK